MPCLSFNFTRQYHIQYDITCYSCKNRPQQYPELSLVQQFRIVTREREIGNKQGYRKANTSQQRDSRYIFQFMPLGMEASPLLIVSHVNR